MDKSSPNSQRMGHRIPSQCQKSAETSRFNNFARWVTIQYLLGVGTYQYIYAQQISQRRQLLAFYDALPFLTINTYKGDGACKRYAFRLIWQEPNVARARARCGDAAMDCCHARSIRQGATSDLCVSPR